jgi:hypothetical protein
MMRVEVRLAGTGTPPDAVYARRIYALVGTSRTASTPTTTSATTAFAG